MQENQSAASVPASSVASPDSSVAVRLGVIVRVGVKVMVGVNVRVAVKVGVGVNELRTIEVSVDDRVDEGLKTTVPW